MLKLDKEEIDSLATLTKVLQGEFVIQDSNQEEMLRILLKRFIIRCTRLARKQLTKKDSKPSEIDLIRHFNVLVEENFKSKKSVAEYAELLFKSPKTITNVFHQYSAESPLHVIHKRTILEARRLLLYTDKSAKEIGFELGYEDAAQFSKFFKKQVGQTTQDFRESQGKFKFN